MDLAHKKCKPCEGGTKPLTREQASEYLKVTPGWSVSSDGLSISKHYSFPNFKKALAFVNQIGEIAESEGHHPDIALGWGSVDVELTTHAVHGLSENDFILAYKIDNPA